MRKRGHITQTRPYRPPLQGFSQRIGSLAAAEQNNLQPIKKLMLDLDNIVSGSVFADEGLALVPGLEANYMSTVLALVRQGLGMTLLPESADEGRSDTIQVPVDHPGVSRETGLITRTGQTLSPASGRFVEVMREVLSRGAC